MQGRKHGLYRGVLGPAWQDHDSRGGSSDKGNEVITKGTSPESSTPVD